MSLAAYVNQVLADNPVAYWQLGELNSNSTRYDTVGQRHLFYFTGTVAPSAGGQGPLPYQNDFATVLTTAGVDATLQGGAVTSNPDDITAEAWVAMTTAGNGGTVFNFGPSQSDGTGFGFAVFGTTLYSEISSGGGFVNQVYTDMAAPVGGQYVWYHVALERTSGGAWNRYLNGALAPSTPSSIVPDTATGTRIILTSGTPSDPVAVAHMAVYETALGAARIRAHYEAGIGRVATRMGKISGRGAA